MMLAVGNRLAVTLWVAVWGGFTCWAVEPAGSGDADKSIEANIRLARDKKADVEKRIAACVALQKQGPKAKAALPALRQALQQAGGLDARFFAETIRKVEGGTSQPQGGR